MEIFQLANALKARLDGTGTAVFIVQFSNNILTPSPNHLLLPGLARTRTRCDQTPAAIAGGLLPYTSRPWRRPHHRHFLPPPQRESALPHLPPNGLNVSLQDALPDTKEGSPVALQASALPVIFTKLQTVSYHPRKEYVSILLSLCTHCGGDVMAILPRDQSLMPRLYLDVDFALQS
nr:U-box domain-containing protein 19-like [Ipomoea batatas]